MSLGQMAHLKKVYANLGLSDDCPKGALGVEEKMLDRLRRKNYHHIALLHEVKYGAVPKDAAPMPNVCRRSERATRQTERAQESGFYHENLASLLSRVVKP